MVSKILRIPTKKHYKKFGFASFQILSNLSDHVIFSDPTLSYIPASFHSKSTSQTIEFKHVENKWLAFCLTFYFNISICTSFMFEDNFTSV